MANKPCEDREATSDWLETILEGYYTQIKKIGEPEIQVLDWDISPTCKESDGYLSELLSVDVSYSSSLGDRLRSRFVAKLLPQNPFNRAFVMETQFDLREIKFYSEICPALKETESAFLLENEPPMELAVPECCYSSYKEGSESILVLTDLRNEGYSVPCLAQGLSLKQAKVAVQSLAEIQAISFVMQEKRTLTLRNKFPYLLSIQQAVEAFQSLVDKGIPLFLKFLSNKDEFSGIRECIKGYFGRKASDRFRQILSPSDKLNTLVHGDFWCNNLMFNSNEDKCRILDWQMVFHGSPSIDVAMLICTSLSPEIRRASETEIIEAYWHTFVASLRKYKMKEADLKCSLNDFVEAVGRAKASSALLMVGSIDIALGDKRKEDRVTSLLLDLVESGVL